MNKIKVLHIITRLDPGGSATNTIETVDRLDPNQFDVFLISGRTVDPDRCIEQDLINRGLSYAFFPNLVREVHLWKDIQAFVELYRFIKTEHFDIVHTHSSKAGIVGRWAAKLAGVKTIVHTPHGHIFYGYFNKVVTTLFLWVERLTARITDKIITLTDRGKQEHIDLKVAAENKFITIYSGINVNLTNPPDVSLELPKDAFLFGTVARLDPIKGITYLIDAMNLVVKQYPQSYLLVVGEGSEKERLQKQCHQLGITQKVLFVGFQKAPDSYIKKMDVFVLPSLNEGMGRVILEAMLHAKPVIASRVGGVPELITDGQNGFLVPPANPRALADAMIKMIEKPLLKEMGVESQAKINERFSLERMVKDIEALYITLISKKIKS
jgi:glycosyltransferase involved in cell wall biosynthesis